MRILCLRTYSHTIQCFVDSIRCNGDEVIDIRWDVPGFDPVGAVQRYKPELVVFIGGSPGHIFLPRPEALAEANKIVSMVLICCDAGDDPWWPLLDEYYNKYSFSIQIGIDGSINSPIYKNGYGLVYPIPLDPALFPQSPYQSRPNRVGFAGSIGERAPMINTLKDRGLLTLLDGYPFRPYSELTRFYSTCKFVVNDPHTGSGKRMHVKARVMEAALAGCVLLEPVGSPVSLWFDPGEDYLEWNDFDQLCELASGDGSKLEAMAVRFRKKALERYSAPVFWRRIIDRLTAD